MAGSLFERLTMGPDAEGMDENASIRANLARVLGTREGAVQARPSYGLPDINDISLSRSELTASLCRAIERNIREFEPRLASPRVTAAPRVPDAPFTLFFTVEAARVEQDGRLSPWTWTVSLDDGKVRD